MSRNTANTAFSPAALRAVQTATVISVALLLLSLWLGAGLLWQIAAGLPLAATLLQAQRQRRRAQMLRALAQSSGASRR